MLYLNLERMFKLRGITSRVKYLKEKGFSQNQANRLAAFHYTTIKFSSLEKLCLAFNCTPNDLLVWKPKPESEITGHPLQKLKMKEDLDPYEIMNNVPMEKLDEFKKSIEEAKSKLLSEK